MSRLYRTHLSMGSNRITDLPEPTTAGEAATKNYVETYTATVSGTVTVDGRKVLDLPNNSTERGPWNPIATFIRGAGRKIHEDEEFASSVNGIAVYNTAANGAVTHTRALHSTFEASVAPPNSSGYSIKISYLNPPGAATPGLGGFIQVIDAQENHTFVQMFQAKIPTGYTLNLAENAQGTNNTSYWMSDIVGTGKWEWYVRVSHCGDSGSFSGGGHVYITGPDISFNWYLASCSVWDVTNAVKLWHDQNDGAGSGLDADLLDANDSAFYLNSSNQNAGTLPAGRTPAYTGDVSSSAGSLTLTIASNSVTYSKMQDVSAASKLIGRGDSGAGDPQEITLGANLSMTGTTLSATSGSSVTVSDDTTQNVTHYPTFSAATSGTISALEVSSTKLTYNPSTGNLSSTFFVSTATSTFANTTIGSTGIEINANGSGNRNAYIDFHGDDTYTDYGLRIIRSNGGPNTVSQMLHRGTGEFDFFTVDAAAMRFYTTNTERARITPTGDFYVDTNTLYVDAANNRVGIGTASPAYPLDIINASPRMRIGDSGTFGGGVIFGNNAHGVVRAYNGVENDVGLFTTSGDVHLSGNSETTGKLIVKNSGRVLVNTMTDNGTSELQINGGITGDSFATHLPGAGLRLINPAGASRIHAATSETGAIKIKLPISAPGSDSFIKMTVNIYEYAAQRTRTITLAGHPHEGSVQAWANTAAYEVGDSTATTLTARFGCDASNFKCVWLGETNTVWDYLTVWISDVQIGYSNYTVPMWESGWALSVVTSFDTVNHLHTVIRQWNANNDGAGSGLDADLLDGKNSSDGVGANTIVTRDSSGYTFVNYINSNTSSAENPTIGNFITTNNSDNAFFRKSSIASVVSQLSGVVRDAVSNIGDYNIASNSQVADYQGASIQLREFNFGGAQTTGTENSPRLSFHWSGRVASQIGMDSNGHIRILNNPGTGYETLRAGAIFSSDNTVWHAGNDGSGSGLDADLLDGIDSTGFARLGATSNFTTAPTINTNTIWHAGNDGAGSGLDADLLDGLNSASANTVSTIVARDSSGNFSAGTVTAALSGNSTTATTLQTARTINGTSFNGSANITTAAWGTSRTLSLTGDVTGSASIDGSANASIACTLAAQEALTFTSDTGSSGASGSTYNTTAPVTVSSNTVGALSSNYLNTRGIADNNNANTEGVIVNYSSNATTNKPSGDDHAVLTLNYSSVWSIQLAGDWRAKDLYLRSQENGTWKTWAKIWHSDNDGAGSGLDADLLDGQTTTFFTNSDNQSAGTLPAARHPAHTGDVTSPANSVALTIATNIVTNAKLAQMAANTIKGNNTGGTANAADLTTAQTKTLLAISLTSDVSGTLQAAQAPAFTGDVTSSAGSLTLTIASNAVTYAKMQDVSAASTLIGRGDSGAGDPQEITIGSGLSMSGTTLSTTGGGGVTIADDTTTNATHYPTFSTATSGSQSTLDVSSTKLTFNPSTGTLSATAFNSLSDEKAKTNITSIASAVNTVKELRGVTFNWADSGNKSSGVIAQEIEKILPFLVCEENGMKSVNYSGIIGYLIEAVKELSEEIRQLKGGV